MTTFGRCHPSLQRLKQGGKEEMFDTESWKCVFFLSLQWRVNLPWLYEDIYSPLRNMSRFWWRLFSPLSSYFWGFFIAKINHFWHYDSSCHFDTPRLLCGVPHESCKHTALPKWHFLLRSLLDDPKDLILPPRGWSVLTIAPQGFSTTPFKSPVPFPQPYSVIS